MKRINIPSRKIGYAGEEAYKSLRTNLIFCGEDKNVIAITSCMPGEGKSSVSLNLSISLAEAGNKVLLVEADLRKPVLMGRLLSEQKIKGLAYYLSGQAELDEIICGTNHDGLQLIVAGHIPPNPTELLGSEAFANMITELRSKYDYIILDTPPLGSTIDCAVMAKVCDGTVMIIEAGAVSYRFAREVVTQLKKTKCPILGVVLNKVSQESLRAYGRYQYYNVYDQNEETGKKKHRSFR